MRRALIVATVLCVASPSALQEVLNLGYALRDLLQYEMPRAYATEP